MGYTREGILGVAIVPPPAFGGNVEVGSAVVDRRLGVFENLAAATRSSRIARRLVVQIVDPLRCGNKFRNAVFDHFTIVEVIVDDALGRAQNAS
jgi:hypothetical protein